MEIDRQTNPKRGRDQEEINEETEIKTGKESIGRQEKRKKKKGRGYENDRQDCTTAPGRN